MNTIFCNMSRNRPMPYLSLLVLVGVSLLLMSSPATGDPDPSDSDHANPSTENEMPVLVLGQQTDPLVLQVSADDIDEILTQGTLLVAQELGIDEVVSRVQTFYDTVENYHADFEQTYTNIALDDSLSSTGHVYFRKPGRMRWDYVGPVEKYLIADGESIWVWEPEFQQAANFPMTDSELPAAIRFLMGDGQLTDDFAISASESCDAESAYCLDLVPLESQGHYQSLRFVVDDENFSVRETTIVDPIGNTNHFVFTNASTGDDLPEERFHFVPPADARIITP